MWQPPPDMKNCCEGENDGKKFAEPNEIHIRIRPQASISGGRQPLAHYISETFILVYPVRGDGIDGGLERKGMGGAGSRGRFLVDRSCAVDTLRILGIGQLRECKPCPASRGYYSTIHELPNHPNICDKYMGHKQRDEASVVSNFFIQIFSKIQSYGYIKLLRGVLIRRQLVITI